MHDALLVHLLHAAYNLDENVVSSLLGQTLQLMMLKVVKQVATASIFSHDIGLSIVLGELFNESEDGR